MFLKTIVVAKIINKKRVTLTFSLDQVSDESPHYSSFSMKLKKPCSSAQVIVDTVLSHYVAFVKN